jgi:hypothetical protein
MKKVVTTFGRLNPPTMGHEKLVSAVIKTAKAAKADSVVFLSSTQDPKKNPLSFTDKVFFARKAFGSVISNVKINHFINMLKELSKKYDDIIIIVGSDRVLEIRKLANRYNGSEYKFNSIEIKSAGERDPDAEDVSGISASKMRLAAAEGDFETFSRGAPSKLSKKDIEKMFITTRKKMNISEEREIRELIQIIEDIEITEHEENIFLELTEDIDNTVEDDYVVNMFPEEEDIQERTPLTIAQRRVVGRRMKRLAPRIARIRKIKAKRMANKDALMKRARKAAITILRRRVAGKKGEKYKSLPVAARIQIDKAMDKQRGKIAAIARRLLPKIIAKERERLASLRGGDESKNESVGPTNMNRAADNIKKEKESDAKRFDRMRDTARTADALKKNRTTKEETNMKTFKTFMDEARRGRPKNNPTPEDEEGAEHIVMQLRKVVSMRGTKEVEFADGKKQKLGSTPQASFMLAKKALAKYNDLPRPADKEVYQEKLGKSMQSFVSAIKD